MYVISMQYVKRIIDEGSIPETCKRPIMLFQSDFKMVNPIKQKSLLLGHIKTHTRVVPKVRRHPLFSSNF